MGGCFSLGQSRGGGGNRYEVRMGVTILWADKGGG